MMYSQKWWKKSILAKKKLIVIANGNRDRLKFYENQFQMAKTKSVVISH